MQDLLYVLQADDAGFLLARPLQADPRQVADLALARLPASGLAVVGAIRAHAEPAHSLAPAFGIRITVKYISREVLRTRVIHGVHADRRRAVILGHADGAPKAHFQPGT
ncbi:hypothetical protein, partial [Pseudomonas syringae]|uniref:hypothetical protein n=1 Tax=Pseudomonas syringae TaxID=317 RepID=UPI003AF326BF